MEAEGGSPTAAGAVSSTTSNNQTSEERGGAATNTQPAPTQAPDQSIGISEDELASSDESTGEYEEEPGGITAQLAAAGPTGMAAAAAISSTGGRKRSHSFETNPSVRKRQQTRLLRKLRQNIEEYSMRVGQQAVILVAAPGKSPNNFKAFGAKPLEDVVKSLGQVILSELENALAHQAPAPVINDDPNKHDLPPLVIDGIPTPVEKMTQAQLRAFIPLMLKYSTGRGKPGWGKENTKPPWWPGGVPWANVRMDARTDEEKLKVSWTHALREIVLNCYKFHERDDLLPTFTEDDDLPKAEVKKNVGLNVSTASAISSAGMTQTYSSPTVVQTISNPDGTISIVQLDPSQSYIQLPDGTTAQIAGLSQYDASQGVHTLAEVATAAANGTEHHMIELSGAQTGEISADGQHIIITGDSDFQMSGGMITVPVPNSMYQQVISNMQGGESSGTFQVVPVQLANGSTALQRVVSTKQEPGIEPQQQQQQQQQQHLVAAPKGLTITPVSGSGGGVQVQSAGGGSIIQIVVPSSGTSLTSTTNTTVARKSVAPPPAPPATTGPAVSVTQTRSSTAKKK